MTKYYSRITEVDGIEFHSKKEAKRYSELKILQKEGTISDLKLQPKFVIFDGFYYGKYKQRDIIYTADFQYKKNGVDVVEDVKGFKTDVYKIKRKMFLSRYKDKYKFIET